MFKAKIKTLMKRILFTLILATIAVVEVNVVGAAGPSGWSDPVSQMVV
jgi:hypothetical protein